MASSHSEDFDLFEALWSQPDLLELVVQRCSGNKNNLRLACSRLRAAVDACVTRLAWKLDTMSSDPSGTFFSDFIGAEGAKNMAVLARCPRLQTLDFNGCPVTDLSPLASCTGLRWVTCIFYGDSLAPLAALTNLEYLGCSQCSGVSDISALAACSALKYLDCSLARIEQLPPLPVRLETLICQATPLSDISTLISCTALKHVDCYGCDITILPPLPASLETLNITGARCADLSSLAACIGLRSLYCSRTPVQDLAPLAACAELRVLDCRDTSIRDLLPLLACKRLEVLYCDNFDGVDDQTRQMLQVCPYLDIMKGHSADEGGNGEEDEEDN